MKKRFFIIFGIVIGFFVAIWMCSLLKCEVLTIQHKNEFIEQYKQTKIIENIDYLKIIKYTSTYAEVYYVSRNSHGNLIAFENKSGIWMMKNWKTVWSRHGSASGIIYPYWWHFVLGGV